MPTLSQIKQISEVETRYTVTGEDQARRAMEGVAGAQDKIARGAEAVAVVTEKVEKRQLSLAGASEKLRRELDEQFRQSQKLDAALGRIDRFSAAGQLTAGEADRLRGLAQTRYGGSNDNDPTRRGLSTYDKQFVRYQAFDVASTLGSGGSLTTAAFQQGPQLLQQLADREGGLTAGLKQAGASAAALVTPFTLGATAVAGLGIAFSVAASQVARDREILEASTWGMGGGTGATVSQLDAIARGNAEAGKVSTSASREIVASYASLGSLSLPVITDLTRATADYAKITGQDATVAATELGRAVAEGGSALDDVAKKLGGLDDATRQLIRTQQEQGDRSGAQQTAADALKASVDANAVATTGWAAAWNTATSAANGYWEAAKRIAGIKLGVAPEGAAEAVSRLQKDVDNINERRKVFGQEPLNGADSSLVRQLATAKVVADQERMIAEGKAAEQRARDASTAAGDVARQVDPNFARLSQLREQQGKLRDALADPLARSKLSDLGQTEDAYTATTRAITTMTDATGKMVSAEKMAQEADQLRIDKINAKTDAEKKAVEERQKAFDLIGKTITPSDARGQVERAGIISGLEKSGGGKSDADTKDEFDRALKSAEDRTRRMQQDVQTYGMGAEAVARYRIETDLLTAAKRAERDITPELTAQIKAYGDRAAEAAKQQEAARESMQSMDSIRSAGRDVFGGMFRDMGQGVTAANTLQNALGRVQDRILSMASTSLVDALFGKQGTAGSGLLGGLFGGSAEAGGIGSFFSKLFGGGFAEGGYTGGGGRLQPAGIVHRGEYVFDQDSVRRMGVSNLDAMRRGLRGYEVGGYVGYTPQDVMRGGSQAANANSAPADGPIIINTTGQPAQTQRVQGPNGPRDAIIIGKTMAGAIMDDPDVKKALSQAYGLRRVGK